MRGCHCWWDEHCGRCDCCPKTRLEKLTDRLVTEVYAEHGWEWEDALRAPMTPSAAQHGAAGIPTTPRTETTTQGDTARSEETR